MRKFNHPWTRRVGVAVSAAVAAAMLTTGAAFAAQPTTVMSTDGYVSSATTPASQPVPEILGISSIEESNGQISTIKYDDWINSSWSLKYILMGSSEYNVNPNPYFNNVFAGQGKVPVYNYQHDGMTSLKRPMAALLPYNSPNDDGSDKAVWDMLPDIIIGCRTDPNTAINYSDGDYAPAAGAANNYKDYSPKAIDYNMSTLATIVDNAYLTAQAADDIVANSNGAKFLRYGSAVQIVKKYESYVKGSQGYILKQLAAESKDKKTYAIVSAVADGTCTLTKTPAKWSSNTRISEALYAVADNYADNLNGNTATIQDLAENVDLIIINNTEKNNQTDSIATALGEYQSKTYWVTGGSTNRGQIYHNASNSMDVATHYGRIMACLYPEYLDQSDMVAFFYEQFYHVKSSALGSAIDQAMDGVRNWDVKSGTGLLEWTAETVSDYNTAAVQAKLTEGINYINGLSKAELDEMGAAASLITLNDNFGGADGVAAFNVTTQIYALPETVTATDTAKVKAAREAFNALTKDQQALVDPAAVEKLTQSEEPFKVSITVPPTVFSGTTFTVPVVLKAIDGKLAAAQATLQYDKNAFELINIEEGPGLSGDDMVFNNIKGKPLFTFMANEADASEGIVVALATFKAKTPVANATISTSKVELAASGDVYGAIINGATAPILSLTNGTCGDINNNGNITIVDAQLVYDIACAKVDNLVDRVLAKFEAGSSFETIQWIADFNHDEYVSANDAFAIQYHIHTQG